MHPIEFATSIYIGTLLKAASGTRRFIPVLLAGKKSIAYRWLQFSDHLRLPSSRAILLLRSAEKTTNCFSTILYIFINIIDLFRSSEGNEEQASDLVLKHFTQLQGRFLR